MTKHYYTFLLYTLLVYHAVLAKPQKFTIPDSLKGKDYEYLSEHVALNRTKDVYRANIYLNTWLGKAKQSTNHRQLSLAYKELMYLSDKKHQLKYADSMLVAALKTKDDLLIGKSYLTKGIAYYDCKQLDKALDNYLIADDYISRTDDSDAVYMVKYTIGLTKYHLRFYHDAIALFTQCLEYYEEEDDRGYLNTLHSIGICYNKIGNYNKCSEINETGQLASKEFGYPEMANYFTHSEGINQFSKGNYNEAVKLLEQSIPDLLKKKDFANESVAWFYIGKCYWNTQQREKALHYFKKVDTIFLTKNYIRPDLREAYQLLIQYYLAENNEREQLHYMGKLVKVNNYLSENYQYLSIKIIKDYDNKKLLRDMEDMKQSLMKENTVKSIVIASLIILFSGTAYRLYTTKKKHRRKFEELMSSSTGTQKEPVTMEKAISDISPNIIAAVTKSMKVFEQKKEYLQHDLTQVKLADLLNTNTRYVPKIVLHVTGKSTIDYICDLKIDYIVELLKKDSRVRNYTNKALGEEVGFGSTQNFTRAFKSRTGISPTYFIAKLKKSLEEDELT